MNDSKQSQNLLLKLVLPKQGSERKVQGGGAAPKEFREVTQEFRKSLSRRIQPIQEKLENINKQAIPVRVELLKNASAKTHRPTELFDDTCPIIAAGSLGELYIKATKPGLKRLNHKILNGDSKKTKKAISSINTIEAITSNKRLNKIAPEKVLKQSPKKRGGFSTKVQLFDFGNRAEQDNIIEEFIVGCKKLNIFAHKSSYSYKSMYFEAICNSVKDLENLAKMEEVRSIQSMPVIYGSKQKGNVYNKVKYILPKPETSLDEYPIVAVVDSGVDKNNVDMQAWVAGNFSTVAPEYLNTEHGTNVAALICFGKLLNPGLKGIESYNCAIFDVQVLPNDDPEAGEVEDLTEPEFLQSLESALKKYASKIRVWNLSIGTDSVCTMETFSSLAIELDRLQEEYNVIFVISAGNYEKDPLLRYPRTGYEIEAGRITSPADSPLGITIGAISHVNHSKTGPRLNELSAFSRHGSGPNYTIKPNFVHYGGSCSVDSMNSTGLTSVGLLGTANVLGTSFSAPLVSRTLAKIHQSIIPAPSNELMKALITHHARHPNTDGRIPDNEVNFLGFGLPASMYDTFYCDPWSCTLVFEDVLRPGYFLEWDDFPYPDSLIKGKKFYGDISMTLALTPVRNAKWGTEYCETHIDAKFGVYKTKNKKDGTSIEVFNSLVPPEHKDKGVLFESYQISELRKWAPIRTYFGSLGKNGERGNRWRLKVQLLCRHGIEATGIPPQKFALILTISDPQKKAPIYNEMTVKMRNKYNIQNIQIQPMVQIRAKS